MSVNGSALGGTVERCAKSELQTIGQGRGAALREALVTRGDSARARPRTHSQQSSYWKEFKNKHLQGQRKRPPSLSPEGERGAARGAPTSSQPGEGPSARGALVPGLPGPRGGGCGPSPGSNAGHRRASEARVSRLRAAPLTGPSRSR